MKITLLLLTFILVACNNDNAADLQIESSQKNTILSSKFVEKHSKVDELLDKETIPVMRTDTDVMIFDLGEGRKAQLVYNLKPTLKSLVKLSIQENTCDKNVGQQCLYAAHFFSYKKKIIWIEHSDPKKISETVEMAYVQEDSKTTDSDFIKIEQESFFGSEVQRFQPEISRNFEDYVICKNWDWIGSQDTTEILSWSGESMSENGETGASENRVSAGYYGQKMIKKDSEIRVLKIPDFYEGSGRTVSLLGHILGDANSLHYKSSDAVCTVTMKADFQNLISEFQTYMAQHEDNYLPYHKDQDSTISDGTIAGFIEGVGDLSKVVLR